MLSVGSIPIPESILKNWQEITDILSSLLDLPAALIMRYTNPEIEVFVSSSSVENPYAPGDKEILKGSGLYCERVINTQKSLLVPNALTDPAWDHNPDIKLNMVSYLGFPISLPDGVPFGTLCILDSKENRYSESTGQLLEKFRNLIQSHLELIVMNLILGDKNRGLTDYIDEIQVLRGMVPICSSCKNLRDDKNQWHPLEEYLIKSPHTKITHSLCPDCFKKLYPDA